MLVVASVDSLNFMTIVYLQPVNAYVSIFGIVFATSASLALLWPVVK
jgi:hypothetical protein